MRDELDHYKDPLLIACGIPVEMARRRSERERPKKPKIRPPPEIKYAQVVNTPHKWAFAISTKVMFGKEEEINTLLGCLPRQEKCQHLFHKR